MLVEFSTQLVQIHAYVISARNAKHLDVSTMCIYSHANTPLGQSERAYYLNYFYKVCYSHRKRLSYREREEDGPGKYSPIFYFRSPGLKNGRQEKYGDGALFMK